MINYNIVQYKKRGIFVGLLLTVFMLFIYASVSAQNSGQSLEVSPPSQEITLIPGDSKKITTKLRNKSNKKLNISVRIEDFTARGEEGHVELTSESPYSVLAWTKLQEKTLTLEAGEQKEIKATLTPPKNAAGGRFGAFVFGVEEPNTNNNIALVSQEVASLFLIRIAGTIDERLKIDTFKAPRFSDSGPINFDLIFENTGNVHTKVYGVVNIANMRGKTVEDIVVPAINVFPGAKRIVEPQLTNKFLLGKYKAIAVMYYGNTQNQSLTAETTFIVFPIKITLIIAIIIIILGIFRKKKKRNNHKYR